MVQQAIDSVLSQSYPELELLVVDDGSTDGTGEALQAYGQRITYVFQPNQGESRARNRGIARSRGDYVAFLDSDDWWEPIKLERQIPVLQTGTNVGLVFCQAWLVNPNGQKLSAQPLGYDMSRDRFSRASLCFANSISAGGSTAIVRRDALDAVGGFNEEIRYGEDWDLWLRLRTNWEFEFVAEPLAYVRRHVHTQCHLPRPEQIDRVLADHLLLLERAFADWNGSNDTKMNVYKRSLARQYGEAALAHYVWSRPAEASRYLDQAMLLDPSTWQDEKHLARQFLNYLVAAAEVQHTFHLERTRKVLREIHAHSPAHYTLSQRFLQQVLARWCAEAAYRSYLAGQWSEVQNYTRQAWQSDKSLLLDMGMLRRYLAFISQRPSAV